MAIQPPQKTPRLASPPAQRRMRSLSSVAQGPDGVAPRLNVFARLPPSCPFVGSFHYAPSAGNRAYSFFEGQIVPHRETGRLHKIKTNPLTGNFHSRPGHYSRLHGLQNFRSEFEGLSAAEDGGMTAIIARIKTSLTEPSSPAVAEATAKDTKSVCARTSASRGLERTGTQPQLRPASHTLRFFHKPHSACDLSSASAKQQPESDNATGRAAVYSKYWEEADTERGRFGTSVDDNALGASSQQSAAAGAVVADDILVEAAVAAGVRGVGKSGVHWGKHHHHHSLGSDDGDATSEPLIGDATAKLRHMYFQQKQPVRPSAVIAAQRARIRVTVAPRAGDTYGRGFRGVGGSPPTSYLVRPHAGRGVAAPKGVASTHGLLARRSAGDVWAAAAAADASGGGAVAMGAGVQGRTRRSTYTGQGWESHTLQAQQKTEEYMQGREALAPDMRPDVVLDNEVSLAYDVDVSDDGMLGAGAYGTVMAAVHRSTGRQVAIKTMLKKYLFSDAEKASVEREIEIQQRLVNNHVIRLYEIYQSPEKLYLVVERAPCGTLEEFLYVRGRMNELDAKRVVRQLLDGLAYLHKAGVVHCDLKPANILFSDIDQGVTSPADLASGGGSGDGAAPRVTPRAQAITPPTSLSGLVVKICDFGHARKVPDCRYYKFTGDIHKIPFHMFKHTGTEGYVAPEVLRQEPYGKAADTWSTGCMLYQMLTGRMPWMPSRACLQRPLSTSGPSWKNISQQAKSLVEDLLAADQTSRADVEQATHHPWFEGIHHCARMPTSAPGGKHAGLSPPLRGRNGSCPAVSLSRSPTPTRDEGVRSGDVAAGGGGGRGSPDLAANDQEGQEVQPEVALMKEKAPLSDTLRVAETA